MFKKYLIFTSAITYSLLTFFLPIYSINECENTTVGLQNSLEEIKSAYKEFKLKCHPDKRLDGDKKLIHAEYIDTRDAYEDLIRLKEASNQQKENLEPEKEKGDYPLPYGSYLTKCKDCFVTGPSYMRRTLHCKCSKWGGPEYVKTSLDLNKCESYTSYGRLNNPVEASFSGELGCGGWRA